MRSRIHNILEITNPDDLISRIFSVSVVALILINIICIVLESVASIEQQYRELFLAIEIGSTIIFATEYVLRLWSCVEKEDEEGISRSNFSIRIRYATTPLAIVDLLAFLPSLLQIIFPGIDLRFLRVLRLLRVFKLTRYFSSFELLLTVLHEERKNLGGIFVIMIVILILAASALYIVERDVQPDKFGSIPQAMWWAIAALTTVGYGDVYPQSSLGQILGSLVTVLGIGMVALPSGILASAFSEQMRRKRESLQVMIDDALEDGNIDRRELLMIRDVGHNLGLAEEQIEELVKHSREIFEIESISEEKNELAGNMKKQSKPNA
ncbi:MAG: Ion transport protein [Gammaproteobacteria bacterium]|nr:Ion transport protein [Gammaproteobacteria bacterium]